MLTKRGKLFVVVGPSGAGKTTIVEEFMKRNPGLLVTVPSYTTRVPRAGEHDGTHYHFITEEEFKQKITEGFFLEWSDAYGSYYGSSRSEIESLLASGTSVLIVIDRNGAEQVLETLPSALVVYIVPPNEETLRDRLRQRGSETAESLAFRIKQSLAELEKEEKKTLACHTVVNNEKSAAIRDFEGFVKGAVLR